jgi:hypothetical protein
MQPKKNKMLPEKDLVKARNAISSAVTDDLV